MENNLITVTFRKTTLRRVIVLGLAVLVFIFAFCHWYSLSETSDGYTLSCEFGPYSRPESDSYYDPLEDLGGWMIAGKVFLIIDLVVFVVYMASNFIDLGAYIPGVSGKLINDIAQKAYFGIMAIALFCELLGDLSCELTEYIHMTSGWYLTLIFTIAGLVNAFNPGLLKNALNKIK